MPFDASKHGADGRADSEGIKATGEPSQSEWTDTGTIVPLPPIHWGSALAIEGRPSSFGSVIFWARHPVAIFSNASERFV